MTKYIINAVIQIEYEIEVEAEDEDMALANLDDWIDEDFKPHQKNAVWDFEVRETK